jgi:hypothetical protein
MAANPKAFCAANAPSKALNGLPQIDGFFINFSKYSCKDK